jgi:hypothetical protein
VLGEVALGDRRAHARGGGVRVAQLGVVALERLQLAEERVVLAVAERRAVEDVVLVRGLLEPAAQFDGAGGRDRRGGWLVSGRGHWT